MIHLSAAVAREHGHHSRHAPASIPPSRQFSRHTGYRAQRSRHRADAAWQAEHRRAWRETDESARGQASASDTPSIAFASPATHAGSRYTQGSARPRSSSGQEKNRRRSRRVRPGQPRLATIESLQQRQDMPLDAPPAAPVVTRSTRRFTVIASNTQCTFLARESCCSLSFSR